MQTPLSQYPRSSSDGSRKPAEATRTSSAQSEDPVPPLILVVDDDPEVCLYLRTCLAPLSRRVLEASNGQEALDVIRQTPGLRLVISDIVMPLMDGITLKTILQADATLHHIPVLLITGDAAHQRDGPVLRKPFNARTLRATVEPLLFTRP